MCGIIGIAGQEGSFQAAPLLLEGLRRLEYRGYDSSGVATLEHNHIHCCKAVGKLSALIEQINQAKAEAHGQHPLPGCIGIGHTRWATHGAATSQNAHPHLAKGVAVVHNGIIENYQELKSFLQNKGVQFQTQTDTEVAAQLAAYHLSQGASALETVRQTAQALRGTFSLVFLFEQESCLIALHMGNPLVIGHQPHTMFIASDVLAMSHMTTDFTFLEMGDIAVVTSGGATIYQDLTTLSTSESRPVQTLPSVHFNPEKNDYAHFMLKEIEEQPQVLKDALEHYIDGSTLTFKQDTWTQALAPLSLSADTSNGHFPYQRILIVACGTSYYAALIAKHWLSHCLSNVWIEVDVASEFRHGHTPYFSKPPTGASAAAHFKTLAIFISQSGETADTLAAMKLAKKQNITTLGIVNVEMSSIAREADAVLCVRAGFEIGVASTKAFTAQLLVLALLALYLNPEENGGEGLKELLTAPGLVAHTLTQKEAIASLAGLVAPHNHAIYLGRALGYPLALEGALKLKEITYIHASAYPSGELKHGPIALIEEGTPVIVLAPFDRCFDKLLSNVQEVAARGAQVIFVSCAQGIQHASGNDWQFFEIASSNPFFAPFSFAPFLQLLAYHTALERGTDVDQPRNLAKSVTVE